MLSSVYSISYNGRIEPLLAGRLTNGLYFITFEELVLVMKARHVAPVEILIVPGPSHVQFPSLLSAVAVYTFNIFVILADTICNLQTLS